MINRIILSFAKFNIFTGRFRVKIYRAVGMEIGQSYIRSNCYFDSKNVFIGNNCSINHSCQFNVGKSNEAKITILDNCYLGMNVNFCCVTHQIGKTEKRAGKHEYRDITIGKGCWIGSNALILPGVVIGEGCVIAAGSVVTTSVESNYLYAGNPAKKIRKL